MQNKLTTFIADQTDPNYQAKIDEISAIEAVCKTQTTTKPPTKYQLLTQVQFQYTEIGEEKAHALKKMDVYDIFTDTKFVTGFVDGAVAQV